MIRLLAAVALMAQASPSSGESDCALGVTKTNSLTASWHGAEIAVHIVVEERKASDLVFPPADPDIFPESVLVVKRIAITVGGAEIFVPRSAYADLLWVCEAKLVAGKKGLQLVVVGGDGAESYRIVLDFDKQAVRKRTLFGGELPADQPLQETRYYQRVLD
jgi:hypothetical protein